MRLQESAKRELERMQAVFSRVEATDEGKELLKLAEAYLQDAKYFYEKKKFLESFEAAIIVWAYIDAGLHLKIFKVPASMRKVFTV